VWNLSEQSAQKPGKWYTILGERWGFANNLLGFDLETRVALT